jgi:hypothetical protein
VPPDHPRQMGVRHQGAVIRDYIQKQEQEDLRFARSRCLALSSASVTRSTRRGLETQSNARHAPISLTFVWRRTP